MKALKLLMPPPTTDDGMPLAILNWVAPPVDVIARVLELMLNNLFVSSVRATLVCDPETLVVPRIGVVVESVNPPLVAVADGEMLTVEPLTEAATLLKLSVVTPVATVTLLVLIVETAFVAEPPPPKPFVDVGIHDVPFHTGTTPVEVEADACGILLAFPKLVPVTAGGAVITPLPVLTVIPACPKQERAEKTAPKKAAMRFIYF